MTKPCKSLGNAGFSLCDPVGIQTQDLQNRNLSGNPLFKGILWNTGATTVQQYGGGRDFAMAVCFGEAPRQMAEGGAPQARWRLLFNGGYIPGLIVLCLQRGVCGRQGRTTRLSAVFSLPL